jgi:ribosome-associated protein
VFINYYSLGGFSKMSSENLRDIAINSLENMKGIDIVCMDVQEQTSIADFMIISTGTSSRHIHALAEEVAHEAKMQTGIQGKIEGKSGDDWILIDLGDVIVHVMLASAREFYSLEDLWMPIKELRAFKRSE